MNTLLFWLGLPLRLFVASILWLLYRLIEPHAEPVNWHAVVCEGLDEGITV